MVDETSEQKRLKDRVALTLLINMRASLVHAVLGVWSPMEKHRVDLAHELRGFPWRIAKVPRWWSSDRNALFSRRNLLRQRCAIAGRKLRRKQMI